MKLLFVGFFLLSLIILVTSYSFVDANLLLSKADLYVGAQNFLAPLMYEKRVEAAVLITSLIVILFFMYVCALWMAHRNILISHWVKLIGLVVVILLFAYPMFSYDLFNYMVTAKVTYQYHENPYVIMPVEIINEPSLSYTRATNKVALYGPTWIALSAIPHILGRNNIWLTLIMFKFLVVFFYGVILYWIWKITKSVWNVLFFALNPLVISEVLINGHNDVVMMGLVVVSYVLIKRTSPVFRYLGYMLYLASVFVKGATLLLLPLVFLERKFKEQQLYLVSFIAMVVVFFITPLREELYPWYAVWFLTFAALLSRKKYGWIQDGCIALSIGLLFRHLPYIATREYGGSGPLIRTLVTITPVLLWMVWKKIQFIANSKKQ